MPPDLYVDTSLDTVENVLHRRGFVVAATGEARQVLFPEEGREGRWGERARYLELMGRASFRKVARAVLAGGGEPAPIATLAQTAGVAAVAYASFLEEIGVAERRGTGVAITRPVDNLGPSLEHYVAHLCDEELRGRAAWGVRLEGLPSGGDFDVLAWLAPRLVHIELKTSRPTEITPSELEHFVQRHLELRPDLSVFMVDTGDELTETLATLNAAIQPRFMTNADVIDPLRRKGVVLDYSFERMRVRPQEDDPGLNFGYHGVYLVNSRPSILTQLRRCLYHHHLYVKRVELLFAKLMFG